MRQDHPTEHELQRLVDGALDAPEAERVTAHCDGCAPCAEVRDGLERVIRAMRADPDEAPPEPLWPHVHRRLRRRRLPFDWTFALGTGLAVTAGVWIGLALGSAPRTSSTEGTADRTDSLTLYSTWGSSLPDVYGLSQETEANGS